MNSTKPNAWDDWIANRREVKPDENLTARIMSEVETFEQQPKETWSLSLIQKLDRNPMARLAVCAAALMVGGIPFLFLAYVAKFL